MRFVHGSKLRASVARKMILAALLALSLVGAAALAPAVGVGHITPALACSSYKLWYSANIYENGGVRGVVNLWQSNCDGEFHTEVKNYGVSAPLYAALYWENMLVKDASGTGNDLNTAEYINQPEYFYGYGCINGYCAQTQTT